VHPSGERRVADCVVFRDPPATSAEGAAATLAAPAHDYPVFVDLDDPVFGVTDDDDIAFG